MTRSQSGQPAHAGAPALRAAPRRHQPRFSASAWASGSGTLPRSRRTWALANLALDLIGQARLLLSYAGELEGRGRDEDALAFLREAPEFVSLSLAEQPNGDFACTIVRQWLIDAWQLELYQGLGDSADARLAAIAAKALKETRYHYRFSSGWLVRLGDGTAESHERAQRAVDELWRFTHELFAPDEIDARDGRGRHRAGPDAARGLLVGAASTRICVRRPSARPPTQTYAWHGKRGVHTEHLSHLLAEMQHLQRTYPGARW